MEKKKAKEQSKIQHRACVILFSPNLDTSIFFLIKCALQGHIALDQAVFPEGTPGFVLDAFARSSLWKIGLDYRHGVYPNFTIQQILFLQKIAFTCKLILIRYFLLPCDRDWAWCWCCT